MSHYVNTQQRLALEKANDFVSDFDLAIRSVSALLEKNSKETQKNADKIDKGKDREKGPRDQKRKKNDDGDLTNSPQLDGRLVAAVNFDGLTSNFARITRQISELDNLATLFQEYGVALNKLNDT